MNKLEGAALFIGILGGGYALLQAGWTLQLAAARRRHGKVDGLTALWGEIRSARKQLWRLRKANNRLSGPNMEKAEIGLLFNQLLAAFFVYVGLIIAFIAIATTTPK